MTDEKRFVEPTPAERGYNTGWMAYHAGDILRSNPYDYETEAELYEGFIEGWGYAQMGDTVEKSVDL